MIPEDIILFSLIGFVVLHSCFMFIKKCKRDRQRVIELTRVVPLPRVPELPDV